MVSHCNNNTTRQADDSNLVFREVERPVLKPQSFLFSVKMCTVINQVYSTDEIEESSILTTPEQVFMYDTQPDGILHHLI